MERYRQETGKRPLYAKKETKDFLEWLENQKKLKQKKVVKKESERSKENWEVLLENWIQQANENEISGEIKKELMEIIRKYRYYRNLYWKLIELLDKANPFKEEIEQFENLVKKLENMTKIQAEIFKNLNAFQRFYNNRITWFEHEILANKQKFIKFLTQKLRKLKEEAARRENLGSVYSVRQNWKELLKSKVDSIEKLNEESKAELKQILRKKILNEEEIKIIALILKKLHINQLIEIFGESFEKHTKNYVKWGWDFYEYIKSNMLIAYFNKHEYKLKEVLKQNLYKIIELSLNKKSRVLKLIQKEDLTDEDRKEPTSVLKNLSQRELESLFKIRIGSDIYSENTKLLIDYLKAEITKLAPFNELYQGRLPSWRISRYLGLKYYRVGSRYVDSISNKLKYLNKNPDYKFSQEELEVAKVSLSYFFGQRASHIIEAIGMYEKSNILKTYSSQQHNVGEPHVFRTLDNPIKSYWYGFLSADGSLIIRYFKKSEKYSPKYRIFIELQEQDKILLQKFRDFIQLDPKVSSYQIKHREREWRNIIREKSINRRRLT